MQHTYSAHGLSFHSKQHSDIRNICLQAGFAGLEAHARMFPNYSAEDFQSEGEAYRKEGLAISSFHLPFGEGTNVSALYETERRTAVATAAIWLENAALLGARVAILHPSTLPLKMEIESFDAFLLALDKSLSELLPRAAALNIILALENMPSSQGIRFGCIAEHFAIFHQKFAHSHLGFCLDTGHALISLHDRVSELYDAMKPALQAFHLEDNAGDRDSHLAPGRGLVNWQEVAALLHEIKFSHSCCIESPPFAYGIDYQLSAWQMLVRETKAILGSSTAL